MDASSGFVARVVQGVNSTPHLARVTHANTFFACGSSGAHAHRLNCFCVISQNSHPHRHISRRTHNVHGLTTFSFHPPHNTPSLLFLWAGVSPAIRNMASSLAVLPNRAPLQVVRSRRGWQYGSYDHALTIQKSKYWVDLQLWRRSGRKIKLENAGFTPVNT